MVLSHYQIGVCDHLRARAGNAAVVAVAGAGKTHTALEGIGHISKFYQVLLAAFNKDIRFDFKAKGTERGYRNVRYTTFNAFGWGVSLQAMRAAPPELQEEKTSRILEFQVMRPKTEAEEKRFYRMRGTVTWLVEMFRNMDFHSVGEAQAAYPEIVEHHNIDVPGDRDFEELLFETFAAHIEDTTTFDYTDQKYMPIHLGLIVPVYDQVIVDEFQDTCELELVLMSRAAVGGQFMAIGDPDQSIYGFKGCDPKRFDSFVREFSAKVLPLSICYRCPVAVVEEAKKIVPRIEAAPGALPGSVDQVKREYFDRNHQPGDFILCRVTEHLVRACLEDIRAGRKAKVRGRDFGDQCVQLLEKVSGGDFGLSAERFVTALMDYEVQQSETLRRFRREAQIIRLHDRSQTLQALAEGCQDVRDVVKRIDSIFCEDKEHHTGIDYMTIHKAKGLQARRVWVLRPDLLPHPRSEKRDWMVAEERRLKYVAITRAESELHWVEKAPGER